MRSGAAGRESSPHHRTDRGDLFHCRRCCTGQPAAELEVGGEGQTHVLTFPDPTFRASAERSQDHRHQSQSKHTRGIRKTHRADVPSTTTMLGLNSYLPSRLSSSHDSSGTTMRLSNVSDVFSKTHTHKKNADGWSAAVYS